MNEQEKKENKISLDTWQLLLQWQEENLGCIQVLTARNILNDIKFFIPNIEERFSRDDIYEAMKKVQPKVDSMLGSTWESNMKEAVENELGISY